MGTGKYANCSVAGDGKLYIKDSNKPEKFKIIDMSAAKIKLETSVVLQEDTGVRLKIKLIGGAIDAHIDINGKVKKQLEKGYEIEFVDLLDSELEEIDELMRSTCNVPE